MRPRSRLLLPAAVLLLSMSAHADDQDTKMAALFDRPLATETVPATSDDELRCTYYRDFLIREKGTDSPAPDAAVIVPVTRALPRPPCKTATGAEIPLKTENYSLLGRKGGYLVFQETDPNGAVRFMVIDAATGRTIFTDGMIEGQIRSVALANGVLQLKYTRGMNGAYSLVSGGKACWDKLVADGTVPPEMAGTPLSAQASIVAYRKEKAPADDPSIVFFEVDMTLDLAGTAAVISRGKPGCSPMP